MAARLAHDSRWLVPPVVAAALLVGLTWSPLLSRHADPALIFYLTPWLLWMPAACLMVAAHVGGWLGVSVAYVTVLGWTTRTENAQWIAVYFALGVLFMTLVRRVPPQILRWGLLASAGLSIAVSLWPESPWRYGPFSQGAFQGAMVAAVLPLAPIWAIPVLGGALLWSHSYMAGIAALTGLLVAHTRQWRGILMVLTIVLVGYTASGFKSLGSGLERAETWRLGLVDFPSAWLFGHGPGSWATRMWGAWCPCPPGEVWWAAHSEPLQWLYEAGAVGAVILALWLRSVLPGIVSGPAMWQGAAAAVLVLSLGLQVFHMPTIAPAMLLVLGGALHGEIA